MIVCGLTAVTAQRVLALPDPKSCAKRELFVVYLIRLTYKVDKKKQHPIDVCRCQTRPVDGSPWKHAQLLLQLAAPGYLLVGSRLARRP